MTEGPAGQSDTTRQEPVDSERLWKLDHLVSELRHSREVTHNIRYKGPLRRMPSRKILAKIVDGLAAALFPRHYGKDEATPENIDYYVGSTLHAALTQLTEQIKRGLTFSTGDDLPDEELSRRALRIARDFSASLPTTRGLLVSDVRAAFRGDPAATGFPEIMLGYPSMTAIIHYRLAHVLYGLGAGLAARLVSEIAHSRTGIDIHPGAKIGPGFFIDHGTGVVIGETAIIGSNVRLYQAVTLGARHFPASDDGSLVKGNARHPIVEDDVVIYAGATILGRITIGHGSTIGGNVWLTRSVPPNSQITQAQARSTPA
jgi:serine O-acetyltransferase